MANRWSVIKFREIQTSVVHLREAMELLFYSVIFTVSLSDKSMADSTQRPTFNTVIGGKAKRAHTVSDLEHQLTNLLQLEIPSEYSRVFDARKDLSDVIIQPSDPQTNVESTVILNFGHFKNGAIAIEELSVKIKTEISNTMPITFTNAQKEEYDKWSESETTVSGANIQKLQSKLTEMQADHKQFQAKFSVVLKPVDETFKLFDADIDAIKLQANEAQGLEKNQQDVKLGKLNVNLLRIKRKQDAILSRIQQVMREVKTFSNQRMESLMFLMRLAEHTPEQHHNSLNSNQHTCTDFVKEFEKQAAELEGTAESSVKHLLVDLCRLDIEDSQMELLQGEWLTKGTEFSSPTILDTVNPNLRSHTFVHLNARVGLQMTAKNEIKDVKLKATSLITAISKVKIKYESLRFIHDGNWKKQQLTVDHLHQAKSKLSELASSIPSKKQEFDLQLGQLADQKVQYHLTETELLKSLRIQSSAGSEEWTRVVDLLKTWNDQQNLISNILYKMDGILTEIKTKQEKFTHLISETPDQKSSTATDHTQAIAVKTPAKQYVANYTPRFAILSRFLPRFMVGSTMVPKFGSSLVPKQKHAAVETEPKSGNIITRTVDYIREKIGI